MGRRVRSRSLDCCCCACGTVCWSDDGDGCDDWDCGDCVRLRSGCCGSSCANTELTASSRRVAATRKQFIVMKESPRVEKEFVQDFAKEIIQAWIAKV